MKNTPKFFTKKAQPLEIPKMGAKKKGNKLRVAAVLTLSSFVLSIAGTSAYGIYSFFDRYELQSPVVIQLPYKKKEIVSPIPEVEKVSFVPKVEASEVKREKVALTSDEEIATYIASKDWDYDTAIKVAKSENWWTLTNSFDCKRQGAINDDGTRDHGLWQINDLHIRSGAITLEDALDCKKSTDFAYRLYSGHNGERKNFTSWASYTNGRYQGQTSIEL